MPRHAFNPEHKKIQPKGNARRKQKREQKGEQAVQAYSVPGVGLNFILLVALNFGVYLLSPRRSKKRLNPALFFQIKHMDEAASFLAMQDDASHNITTRSVFNECGDMRWGTRVIQQALSVSYGTGGYVWQKVKCKKTKEMVMRGDESLDQQYIYFIEGNLSAIVFDQYRVNAYNSYRWQAPGSRRLSRVLSGLSIPTSETPSVILLDFKQGYPRVTVPFLADHVNPNNFSLDKMNNSVFNLNGDDTIYKPADFLLEQQKKHSFKIYKFGLPSSRWELLYNRVHLAINQSDTGSGAVLSGQLVVIICSYLKKQKKKNEVLLSRVQ
eukprot:gb/GEZN01010828.1/.p1 GENE.gb/GEZN01010828.1/~~gb/GEZN01010828.1/.p1  ORF type:complete len:325 (-),score=43.70 gb/GEZN01010828.1/:74-1048(-)